MYENFYKLRNDPFRLLPEPDICYPHTSCAKAWAYLRYAVNRGEGIVVITGVPGSGKTTLAERLLNELNRSKTISVRLVAQEISATDLLRKVGYAFGLAVERLDHAMLMHRLEQFFFELERSNRRAVVVIDEAQALPYPALEAMRLLTDLQSNSKSVVQLFLLGHEELETTMSEPRLAQFQQRVIASCRLQPMSLSETKAYLEYRLAKANWQGKPTIDGRTVLAIHKHSGGLPRQVNKICSRLFLYGSAEEKAAFTEQDVNTVVEDFRDESLAPVSEVRVDPGSSWVEDADAVRQLALVPPQPQDTTSTISRADGASTLRLETIPAAISRAIETPASAPTPERHQKPASRSPSIERPRPSNQSARGIAFYAKALYRNARRHVRAITHRPLFAAAASLVIVPIAAAMLLNNPAPQRTDPPKERTSGTTESTSGLSYASTLAEVGKMQTTASPELQPITDRTSHNEMVSSALAPRSGLGGSQEIGDDVKETDVDNEPGEEAAIGADTPNDSRNREVASTAAIPGSSGANAVIDDEVGSAGATQPIAVVDDQQTGLIDGDPSVVLPAPAAGTNATPADDPVTLPEGGVEMAVLPEPTLDEDSQHGDPSPTADQASPIELLAPDATDLVVNTAQPTESDADPASVVLAHADIETEHAELNTNDAGMIELLVSGGPEPTVLAVSSTESRPIPVSELDSILVDQAQRDADEIKRLLASAEKALARSRLLFPESDSAYGYFNQVLELDGQNGAALAGMKRIVERYQELAEKAFAGREYDRATLFVDRALRVLPDDTKIVDLRQRIEATIAEEREQAELQRQAEAARLAAEAAELAKPKEPAEPPEMRRRFDELIWFN